MPDLGVKVFEQATSVSTPNTASVSVPFVVGAAPVHAAAKPAPVNTPVLCTSWDEAVQKLGYADDWKKYPLCEFMYSHFQLYGCQPVVFCNVLDPAANKESVPDSPAAVTAHQITLPAEVIPASLRVFLPGENDGPATGLTEGSDYAVLFDSGKRVLELLEDGNAYSATALRVAYDLVKPDKIAVSDIAAGIAQADAAMTAVGLVPDLICAPGWSHVPAVAALMAVKAASISGMFRGLALIDCDCSDTGVTEYSQLAAFKDKNSLTDKNMVLCWPMVRLGDHTFHLSTQLAGLMAQTDAANRSVPYESPSNKNLRMDACILADGSEINLTWPQTKLIAGEWGAVTAMNFPGQGWIAKGNYTACFPGNPDVKDHFIPVSRMFGFIGNTLIRTFWPKLDKPMTTALRDSILQTCNGWLSGLCGSGYLYGARCEMLADENPVTNLLAGKITLHVYNAPPVPMQSVDFILEFDVSYMEAALA